MTETALNERIAELQENESEAAHQWQKARRRLRRDTSIRKTDSHSSVPVMAWRSFYS